MIMYSHVLPGAAATTYSSPAVPLSQVIVVIIKLVHVRSEGKTPCATPIAIWVLVALSCESDMALFGTFWH